LAKVKKLKYLTPLMFSPSHWGEQTRKGSVEGRDEVVYFSRKYLGYIATNIVTMQKMSHWCSAV
jgi:hypothetical protein